MEELLLSSSPSTDPSPDCAAAGRGTAVLDVSPPVASLYGTEFFDALSAGTRRSAAIVVPLLIELFRPRSVVDVGCGTGQWLSAFRQHGVADVLGIDGGWVSDAQLEVPAALFHQHDLGRPLELERTFDLALCLEVAEHLAPEAARPLVESLTRLAPVVVFSAAIPFQGGDGHVNEQWPSFWSDLFAARGYGCLDHLRLRLWRNPSVEVWYRQNLLCYVADDRRDIRQQLSLAGARSAGEAIDAVHPDLFLRVVRELEQSRRRCAAEDERRRRVQQELRETQIELEGIRSSRPWRLWQAVRPGFAAVRRAGAYLRPR